MLRLLGTCVPDNQISTLTAYTHTSVLSLYRTTIFGFPPPTFSSLYNLWMTQNETPDKIVSFCTKLLVLYFLKS